MKTIKKTKTKTKQKQTNKTRKKKGKSFFTVPSRVAYFTSVGPNFLTHCKMRIIIAITVTYYKNQCKRTLGEYISQYLRCYKTP